MKEILNYFPNLSTLQIHQLSQLKELYTQWNSQINVISRKDFDSFYIHHVLHSLAIAKVIEFKKGTKILDVGTGGGFPAIPLAIYFPECSFVAVDSIGKKIKVVNGIVESLSLNNVKAYHARAESIDLKFDFIVSRAVTRAANFVPWVKNKFCKESFNEKKNGFLFLKGGDLHEEMAEVQKRYEIHELSKFFEEAFFDTKKVIYLSS